MVYVVGGYLLVLSVEDIRRKKLPVWILLAGCLGGVLHSAIVRGVIETVLGMFPGLILLGLAMLMPQGVGVGDGILAITYGLFYGWLQTCIWLMLSFFVAAICGVLWRSIRIERCIMMPFVPFMALAHIGVHL